jgi:hypothetical protein
MLGKGMARIDLTGQTFGTWRVVGYSRSTYQPLWVCECVCGTTREVSGAGLRSGMSSNCGCQRRFRRIHGHTRQPGQKGKTYRIWKAMRSRCQPGYNQASDYYHRGISVCSRWDDFSLFLSDMGECPEGHSIDRIDNDKGYEPNNCRWATAATQRRNSRRILAIELDGQTYVLKDAAAKIGVSDVAIHQERKRHGGTFQEAFDRVKHRRR